MGKKCEIVFCPSRAGETIVSLHAFPRNKEVFDKWCEKTKIKPDRTSATRKYLCSLHFSAQDFNTSGRLNPNAEPNFGLEQATLGAPLDEKPFSIESDSPVEAEEATLPNKTTPETLEAAKDRIEYLENLVKQQDREIKKLRGAQRKSEREKEEILKEALKPMFSPAEISLLQDFVDNPGNVTFVRNQMPTLAQENSNSDKGWRNNDILN